MQDQSRQATFSRGKGRSQAGKLYSAQEPELASCQGWAARAEGRVAAVESAGARGGVKMMTSGNSPRWFVGMFRTRLVCSREEGEEKREREREKEKGWWIRIRHTPTARKEIITGMQVNWGIHTIVSDYKAYTISEAFSRILAENGPIMPKIISSGLRARKASMSELNLRASARVDFGWGGLGT